MTGGEIREDQGQIGITEEWECRACTRVDRKQSREGYTETARSGKGEQEPANRGTNNEDKTRDGKQPGLLMKTDKTSRIEKPKGEVEGGKNEATKGNSYLLTITRE